MTAQTLPPPVRFLNYRGDQTHAIGEVMGPNQLGELLTVVTADYDPESSRTHLGFAYGAHQAPTGGGAR